MLKHKLPKDWIAVNSKTHPDRVYYFNVKTNQSSWREPTLDETDKISSVKRTVHEKGKHRDAVTPERNIEAEDTTCRQHSHNKIMETSQIKAVGAKALQRSGSGNKSLSISEAPYARPVGNINKISSPRVSASKLKKNNKDDTLITPRNKNEVTSTQQMNVLRIKQRNSIMSSKDKTLKEDSKNKQQGLSNQKSKQKKNQNVPREKQGKSFKKNLAKERMEKLRKNLSIDKEKFDEMSQANLVNKKIPQKSSRLPNSISNSLGSTYVYRNVDVRLKKLHNRIIKNTIYEKNITLNNDKLQSQPSNVPVIENMTDEKLIEKAKQEVLDEEMDWEPMKDEEIALEVEVVRTQIDRENRVDETNCTSENTAELTQPNETESHEKGSLYIVVDTNVFLSNLEIIEEAKDATFKNYPRPFIVIPWTVICELDYFKDNKSKYELSIKARKAISFIHNQFSSKHPRVIGQTRDQAKKNKEDFSLDCPDDEILQCCLQIHQLRKSVVLLSYDKNLCTKAMIYNIRTLGRHDPLENIDDLDTNSHMVVNRSNDGSVENSIFNEELRLSDDIFEDMKLIMKNFLSKIITKQMSEIYGEAEWRIYVIIKPPWTIVTALKCAIKHWIAAINESFQRCAEHILKELQNAFEYVPVGGRKLQDVEYILGKSSDLVQTVNMDKHCDLMTETFNAITELKKKCTKCMTDIDQKKLHEKIGIAENIQEQEMRAEKVFQCFHQIYDYARNICGLACSSAGMAYSFTFKSVDPPISQTCLQHLKSEISRKVTDLTQNLNKLLMQAENSIKHQMLLNLQQNLSTFLPDSERVTFDVIPLDVYYCVKLKEESLKTGLRQLQELTSHFCALATRT